VYFLGYSNYSKVATKKNKGDVNLPGENTIKIGKDLYKGFGLKTPRSEVEWQKFLLKMTKRQKPNHAPGSYGGYKQDTSEFIRVEKIAADLVDKFGGGK